MQTGTSMRQQVQGCLTCKTTFIFWQGLQTFGIQPAAGAGAA
jgi:hypothetical protein